MKILPVPAREESMFYKVPTETSIFSILVSMEMDPMKIMFKNEYL